VDIKRTFRRLRVNKMKVCIISEKEHLHAVADRMVFEGDEVSLFPRPPKDDSYDLVLTDTHLPTKGSFTCLIVGGDEILPSQVTNALFENTCPNPKPFYYLSRWFDSYNGFSPQTLVCFPVYGMMNGDLGRNVCTGIGLRYVDENSSEEELFERLKDILGKMHHNGFVSLAFSKTGSLAGVYTYMPFNGLQTALEGVKGRLSEYFAEPYLLQQSWAVGLLLTVYPYPFEEHTKERVFFEVNENVRKHLWLPFTKHSGKSSYTDRSVIGLSTAWHPSLSEANRRATRTCKRLTLEEKQYRTDLASACQLKWISFQEKKEKDHLCVQDENESE